MTDRGTLSQRNAEIDRGYNNMRRLIIFTGSAVALTCIALVLISWSVPSMADQRKDDGGKNQQGQADKRDDRHDGSDADITWNPQKLSVSIKPNEATSVPVTLTVREKQDNQLTVFASTSLKDIVSVTPTTLGQLRKGQTATITVVLKLPILAQPGTTTGFIQLYEQDGKKRPEPIAKALPIFVTTQCPCLPPDPGEAGKVTIAGIDSDNDGVRDDVQRYIAVAVSGSARHREALKGIAIATQKGLLSQTREEGIQAAMLGVRSIECLSYLGVRKQNKWKEVQALMLNTEARLQALDAYNDRINGSVLPGVRVGQERSACTFDVEALPN